MTLDILNRMLTSANQVGWTTIVVGKNQYEEGKKITYSSAPPNYSIWDNVTYNKFKLKIVKKDFLGIEP